MAKLRALKKSGGWIEVICGPMFAGKSDELIRTLNKWKYADIEYLIFKPKCDTRTKEFIKSRSGLTDKAIEIDQPSDIIDILLDQTKTINVIAIDEAQFFDEQIVDIVDLLAKNGFVIIVAGLDCDFKGQPFNTIAKLLAKADIVNKLTAICTECGALATRTQRIINNKNKNDVILIGNSETYAARCKHCYKYNDHALEHYQNKINILLNKK